MRTRRPLIVFIERLREDKTEKVYRICKIRDSSPRHHKSTSIFLKRITTKKNWSHKLSPRNLGRGSPDGYRGVRTRSPIEFSKAAN